MSGQLTNGSERHKPAPYVVARTAVLERVATDLRRLSAEQVLATPILNLHGVVGIGKSEVLRQAQQRFDTTVVTLLATFSTAEYEQCQAYEALLATTQPLLADASTPLLLLLDELDEVRCWQQIQEHVIKPLLRRGQVLIICASLSPIFWHFWELEEQCEPLQLGGFSEQETCEFLAHYDRELLGRTAYHATAGYPLALVRLVERMLSDRDAVNTLPQSKLIAETSLSAYGVQTAAFEDRLFNAIPATMRQILRIVGVVRRIDVTLFEQLISVVQPELVANGSLSQTIRLLLQQLQQYHWLERYRRDRAPYQLAGPLRQLLVRRLRQSDPDLFAQTATFLLDHYASRVREQPITEAQALLEWLYVAVELLHWHTAQPQQLLAAFAELVQTRRLALGRFVELLYQDNEIVQQLRAAHLLEPITANVRPYLDEKGTLSLNVELAYARDEVLRPIFTELLRIAPQVSVAHAFDAFLQVLIECHTPFDATRIADHLHQTKRLSVQLTRQQIDAILRLLNRRGFLGYTLRTDQYQIEPPLLSLVRPPVMRRAPTDYLTQIER